MTVTQRQAEEAVKLLAAAESQLQGPWGQLEKISRVAKGSQFWPHLSLRQMGTWDLRMGVGYVGEMSEMTGCYDGYLGASVTLSMRAEVEQAAAVVVAGTAGRWACQTGIGGVQDY